MLGGSYNFSFGQVATPRPKSYLLGARTGLVLHINFSLVRFPNFSGTIIPPLSSNLSHQQTSYVETLLWGQWPIFHLSSHLPFPLYCPLPYAVIYTRVVVSLVLVPSSIIISLNLKPLPSSRLHHWKTPSVTSGAQRSGARSD